MTLLAWLASHRAAPTWLRHGELQLVLQFRAPQAWWWGDIPQLLQTLHSVKNELHHWSANRWRTLGHSFLNYDILVGSPLQTGSPAGVTYLWSARVLKRKSAAASQFTGIIAVPVFNGSTSRLFHAEWRFCLCVEQKNAKPQIWSKNM